jgi:flagellar assembly protein FliH
LEWVADALRLASGSSDIIIQLNPHDFQTLRTQVKQLAKVLSPVATARVVSKEDISLGGCRIETEFGGIDYQLETQLERMAEELS